MGKRLLRILSASIAANLPTLINKELNLFLKNGTALHGRIRRYTAQELVLEDMASRLHNILLADVEEIVLDQFSQY